MENNVGLDSLVLATKEGIDVSLYDYIKDFSEFVDYLSKIVGFVDKERVNEIFIKYVDSVIKNNFYSYYYGISDLFELCSKLDNKDIDLDYLKSCYLLPTSHDFVLDKEKVGFFVEHLESLFSLYIVFYSDIGNIQGVIPDKVYNDLVIKYLKFNIMNIQYINTSYVTDKDLDTIKNILFNCISMSSLKAIVGLLKGKKKFKPLLIEIAHRYLDYDYDLLLPYIDTFTERDLELIEKKIDREYYFINRDPRFLDYKSLVLTSIRNGNGFLYLNWASNGDRDEYVYDDEVIKTLLSLCAQYIFAIPKDVCNYKEYVKYAVSLDPAIIHDLDKSLIDDDLVDAALDKDINVILFCDTKYWKDRIDMVLDGFATINVNDYNFPIDKFKALIQIASHDQLNKVESQICHYLSLYYSYLGDFVFDNKLKPFYDYWFVNEFSSFMKDVSLDVVDYLSNDNQKVYNDAIELLERIDKVNIFDNSLFTYNLVAYVLPVIGMDYTVSLIKYDTKAYLNIERLVIRGKEKYVKDLLSLNEKYKIIDCGNRNIHYLFDCILLEPLFTSIIEEGRKLSDIDVRSLQCIIFNENYWGINSYDDLVRYDEIVKENLIKYDQDESFDMSYLDKGASVFGFSTFIEVCYLFFDFNLSNFKVIMPILKSIRENYGEDVFKELMFTKEEILYIRFLDKLVDHSDDSIVRNASSIRKVLRDKVNSTDFHDYTSLSYGLIFKMRKIYSLYFNLSLTKVKDVSKYKSFKKGDTWIYELDDCNYDFLAHCIHNFDLENTDCYDMLNEDLTLWNRLDGSSTISLSTFSNNLWKIIIETHSFYLLFDEVPSDFLMYMYKSDLGINHGKNVFEPRSSANEYTNLEGLKQRSAYYAHNWNEVAGYRDGLIPSAIMVTSKVINDNIIKAADYFSRLKGEEVPIIYINIDKKPKAIYDYEEAKKEFKINPTEDLINKILFPGEALQQIDDNREKIDDYLGDLQYKASFVINNLNRIYQEKGISFMEYIKLLRCLLNDLYSIVNFIEIKDVLFVKKIDVFIKMICYLKNFKKLEIDNIQLADFREDNYLFSFKYNGEEYRLDYFNSADFDVCKESSFERAIHGLERLTGIEVSSNKEFININSGYAILGKCKILGDKEKLLLSGIFGLDEKTVNIDSILYNLIIDYLVGNVSLKIDNTSNMFLEDKNVKVYRRDLPEYNIIFGSFLSVKEVMNKDNTIYKNLFEAYNNGIVEIDFTNIEILISKIDLLTDEEYLGVFKEYLDLVNYLIRNELQIILLSNKKRLKDAFAAIIDSYRAKGLKKD